MAKLPEVMRVKDIQNFLGIGRGQAYALANSKEFPTTRVGKSILIYKNSFLNWLEKGIPKDDERNRNPNNRK
jgi:excisionase family DNA binding protein